MCFVGLFLIFSSSNCTLQWRKIELLWSNNISITKHTKHHKALLSFTIINNHRVSQNFGQFLKIIQSSVDIGNLLQVSIFLCSEESNLNVTRLLHSVLLDCDTHPPPVVCCYFLRSMTDIELLIHNCLFTRFGSIYRYDSKQCDKQYSGLRIMLFFLFH